MRRGRIERRVSEALQRLKSSRWVHVFSIGLLLGITVALMKVSLGGIPDRIPATLANAQPEGAAGMAFEPPGTGSGSGANKVEAGSAVIAQQMGGLLPKTTGALNGLIVRTYMMKEQRMESLPLEEYVRGVIAAEMPADFELEALKAQAIAARTYIVRRLASGDDSGVENVEADVTDTIAHQAYLPLAQLKQHWQGAKQTANMKKLNEAVKQTEGLIVTYNGEPIQAAFFSTSSGYTENSEDYWSSGIPYLRSVASPWDIELSPRYKESVELTLAQFYEKLGLQEESRVQPSIRVLAATAGKSISKIEIAGTVFTGREVRERLGLASAAFTWKMNDRAITITTYGYGHGVGMSQWGANGMAKLGYSAKDILTYYYTGALVEQASKFSGTLLGRS
ncbi:stage II sporulation protein D [Paenibacillus sp. FSL H8-0537]|uniref:stage II sporulation protein D n=1 Tax=Paenibacillus sp. FSL H8-0537 TaxID=2921399 RepID=UPI0031014C14